MKLKFELGNDELDDLITIIEFAGTMAMNTIDGGKGTDNQNKALARLATTAVELINTLTVQAESYLEEEINVDKTDMH